MIPSLATLDEAADELGVKKGSIKNAADEHGLLVRIGRSVRIDRNDYSELVKRCQDPAKAPAFTNSVTGRTGISVTPATQTGHRSGPS